VLRLGEPAHERGRGLDLLDHRLEGDLDRPSVGEGDHEPEVLLAAHVVARAGSKTIVECIDSPKK
jgi:hypothetical protein